MKKSQSTPVFPSGLQNSINPITSTNEVLDTGIGGFDGGGGEGSSSGQSADFFDMPTNFHPRRQQLLASETFGQDAYMETPSDTGTISGHGYGAETSSLFDDYLNDGARGMVGGGDLAFNEGGHVGYKRNVQGLSRMSVAQGSSNLRRSLLRHQNDPNDADLLGNSYSCPDLAKLKHSESEGNFSEFDPTEDGSLRKQKRLARNRAAARIRRQRRKTIVDTLERELVDLNRSIAFLKKIAAYKENEKRKRPEERCIGVLSIPKSNIISAHESATNIEVKVANGTVTASALPGSINAPKGSVLQKASAKSKSMKRGQEDEDDEDDDMMDERSSGALPTNPFAAGDTPVHIQTEVEAKQVLLEYLVGNPQETNSLSMSRRRAAIQLFLDRQIYCCHKLACAGLTNSYAGSILFESDVRNGSVKKSESIGTITELLRSMKLSLTHHVAGSPAHHKENSLAGKPAMSSAVKLNSEKPTPSVPPDLSIPGTVMRRGVIEAHSLFGKFTQPPVSSKVSKTMTAQLAMELSQTLNLSPEQKSKLRQLSHGLQQEQIRLQALQRVALAFACHGWLEYDTLEQAQGQFRGLLSDRQMNYFYNFIWKNQVQIDRLDLS